MNHHSRFLYIYGTAATDDGHNTIEEDICLKFPCDIEGTGGGSGNTGWNVDLAYGENLDKAALASFLQQYLPTQTDPKSITIDDSGTRYTLSEFATMNIATKRN